MKKKNKVLIAILILLFSLGIVLAFGKSFGGKTIADSGWDTSYDSGGSDWGSSSSDWGSSSSYSSGSSSNNPIVALIFIIVFFSYILIMFYVLYFSSKNKGKKTTYVPNNFSTEIEKIKEIIPDFDYNKFLDDTYKLFIDVQNAWSEFDYDSLRKLLSDELYNTYHSQLKVLKAKKQKNIMSDFKLNSVFIESYNAEDGLMTINVSLDTSFYDYVVDEKEKVVRGTKKIKVNMLYRLTLVGSISKTKTKNCPSCGAELDDSASNICPYCKSTIVSHNHDWVLSKKEVKNQY